MTTSVDFPALELTLFAKLFAAVAEEMGIVLQKSAFSPNIKERRDFSCAVFTAQGELLAQAAHIPVHLGALPATLAQILPHFPLEPGDVLILNDPYQGGTHLPDLTLVAAMHEEDGGRARDQGSLPSPHAPLPTRGQVGQVRASGPDLTEVLPPIRDWGRGLGGGGKGQRSLAPSPNNLGPAFYLAVRAHHADVGGAHPGSMPLARDLREEGVIIPPSYLCRRGVMEEAFLAELLAKMRAPEERRGDLAAQLAALHRGQVRLQELLKRHGRERLADMAGALLEYSERAMRAEIAAIPDGVYRFEDYLDDDGYEHQDLAIRLTLTVRGPEVVLDFRETCDQAAGGVNAVPPVVEAACYYAFLCLLAEEYPINQGCFRPLKVITRRGSLLDPVYPAPVAAGNVETSQRLVDVVFGALAQALPERIPAASQGTMNNLAFGGREHQGREYAYYETIAGGMGGSPAGPGLSGTHSHMTNTRNTPIEVLEHDYPVRLERYVLREGSGGSGRHPGGLGLIREFRFLLPVTVSLLTERRRRGPYGLAGGGPGAPGENRLTWPDDRREVLPAKVNLSLPAGSLLAICTPGGGGWGEPLSEDEGPEAARPEHYMGMRDNR
ncbi:MAG: hydantoinase B/oxoprolinase family protein [Desulfobaccales bacterium]